MKRSYIAKELGLHFRWKERGQSVISEEKLGAKSRFTLISKFKSSFPDREKVVLVPWSHHFWQDQKQKVMRTIRMSFSPLKLEVASSLAFKDQQRWLGAVVRTILQVLLSSLLYEQLARKTTPTTRFGVVSRSLFLMERLPSNFSAHGGEDDPGVAVFCYSTRLGTLQRCLRCRDRKSVV